ncbi:MAG: cysteine--tRNA ligase [Parcubacteria group bacterium]
MISFFKGNRPKASLTLYNTLSEKKEEFKPQNGRTVKLYTCGPTVYNFAHIGNLRTYIFEDILRRTMEISGYRPFQVMNITDIDDKIIKLSVESQKKTKEITLPFEKHFFEDITKLNIEMPERTPRATDHVKEMISLVEKLLNKGYAYKEKDGSVYFSISKFKDYGKLSHQNFKELESSGRISNDEYEKNEIKDFALWKVKKPGEPYWDSPWGEGRPGWHIECSAMAMKYLGDTLDIHTGGVDNIFPHHENEIAQSEAATGKLFAKFFLHGEHLLVNGEKMAKSAGNFYTLRDIEEKGYDPLSFRYLCLQTHYRSKMNFTWESLGAAASAFNNLRHIFALLQSEQKEGNAGKISVEGKTAEEKMFGALSDDLNTPKALAVLWDSLKDKDLSVKDKLWLIKYADRALGLKISGTPEIFEIIVPEELSKLADEREKLRKKGDYLAADKIRKKIEEKGYEITDEPGAYKIRKK